MRIQPRHQILDIWRAVLATAYQDSAWSWGGRDDSNSISDAEQLLCLLYPATEIDTLTLDRADSTGADVRRALRPLGDTSQLPRALLEIVELYLRRYTAEDGEPIFSSGRYVSTDDPNGVSVEQSDLHIVDAYSMSVTLCLATLGFLEVYEPPPRRVDLRRRIEFVREAMSRRLTDSMVGLLRSFVVQTTKPDEVAGRAILSMINVSGVPEQVVLERLRRQLARVRSRLRDDIRIGLSPDLKNRLDDDSLLFECGWTWGIAENAEPIDFVADLKINKRQGCAEDRPYLYFTVVALDGINDLVSSRTRELGLLNDEQRRLADALQIRWDMTQRYWSTVARFGDQMWPLENIPWRTSDDEESDYFSLLVSAVLVQDLQQRRATDDDLTRAVQVFEELARRGRITSRVTRGDRAIALHEPGVKMSLRGADLLGPPLYRNVADFAPLLLKRSLQAAGLSQNVHARDRLMLVAESTMDHLSRRRLRTGSAAAGLWDDPVEVLAPYATGESDQRPSWYITERVVEGLVAATKAFDGLPLRSGAQVDHALQLLSEADHLLNREMMTADADDQSAMQAGLLQIEGRLTRARRILNDRPGTAAALAMDALRQLDGLAVADSDATRSM
ncbi:SCO2524 family protein [Pseudofrankia sp. DC12]|uniref:SCO2524 family protein n=1 Tax=Pseudofrankia sp. DC12 TaxID=683315 RepID=UPI0005F82C60|nr:SCO2524 family protein [Pseudofrankia sp. DC12]